MNLIVVVVHLQANMNVCSKSHGNLFNLNSIEIKSELEVDRLIGADRTYLYRRNSVPTPDAVQTPPVNLSTGTTSHEGKSLSPGRFYG